MKGVLFMTEHFIFVFMSFVITFVPIINFLQLQMIIKKIEKNTNEDSGENFKKPRI